MDMGIVQPSSAVEQQTRMATRHPGPNRVMASANEAGVSRRCVRPVSKLIIHSQGRRPHHIMYGMTRATAQIPGCHKTAGSRSRSTGLVKSASPADQVSTSSLLTPTRRLLQKLGRPSPELARLGKPSLDSQPAHSHPSSSSKVGTPVSRVGKTWQTKSRLPACSLPPVVFFKSWDARLPSWQDLATKSRLPACSLPPVVFFKVGTPVYRVGGTWRTNFTM